jgi:sterol desaturase/sphingolipid hydroxylase (fatty acid hydroxylase superfamily)
VGEPQWFLQESWRAFFSVFTLGFIIDLQLAEAGKAALYSTMFLIGLSMFYHSAIHVRLPWRDRMLVTPQVHRIHHSVDAEHYNRNFADALPIFDIVFGTYYRAGRDEFPARVSGPTPRRTVRSCRRNSVRLRRSVSCYDEDGRDWWIAEEALVLLGGSVPWR